MLSELKPCPFCGGSSISVYPRTCERSTPYNAADRAFPVVRCRTCGADAQGEDWGAPTTAVEKWNHRAEVAGWIPVDKRRPEKDEEVVVYRPFGKFGHFAIDSWGDIRECPVDFSTVSVVVGEGWGDHGYEEVSHWCPLAAPGAATPANRFPVYCDTCARPVGDCLGHSATPEPTNANRLHNEVLRLQVNEHSLLTHQQASRYLLQRATKQLERWAEKYGAWQPNWLPPAGDIRLAEDIAEHLSSSALSAAGKAVKLEVGP